MRSPTSNIWRRFDAPIAEGLSLARIWTFTECQWPSKVVSFRLRHYLGTRAASSIIVNVGLSGRQRFHYFCGVSDSTSSPKFEKGNGRVRRYRIYPLSDRVY